MTKTEQKVIKFIQEKELISTGDKILIALSGGADSVFLLTFLLKFCKKYKIEIGAFHLNHMLRGNNSNRDEEFCRRICREKGIIFFSTRIDIKKYASDLKISIEEAGRNARYELLEKTAVESGYMKVATGHNQDDNTETVLLNLVKGTGIKGISGIPYRRGIIIRPVLGISKAEIRSYLEYQKIPYINDKSNSRDDFERNYLRNRVLPLLKRINPSLDDAVLRSSDTFKDYSHFIERKIVQGVEYVLEKGEDVRIILRKFNIVDKELRGGIIKNIIERNFLTSLTFKDVLSVVSLAEKETGKSLILRGNLRVFRDREHLVISSQKPLRKQQFKVKIGEKIVINGSNFSIEEWKGKVKYSNDKNVEYVNGDFLGEHLIVREWKEGDKFNPIGMKGTSRVSDFLNSIKIPSSEKKRKMILTDGKDIIWIIGYRINEKFKITNSTRRILKLCLM